MFEDSPVSKRIFKYFNYKYGQVIAPVGLLKSCAVVSNQLGYPRLNVWCVASTRQYKSQTSKEIQRTFSKKYLIDAGSDFTIHSLHDEYGEDVDGKTFMVNDATVLFASKSARTKERLVGAFAELLSDEQYTYKDFRHQWTIQGKCTAIVNQTTESFNNYKNRLLGSTLLERFFTSHHRLTLEEQRESRVDSLKKFKPKYKIKQIKPRTIRNLRKYRDFIKEYAMDYTALAQRSYHGCRDTITAMLKSHAILNDRNRLVLDDVSFVRMMRDYLIDPLKVRACSYFDKNEIDLAFIHSGKLSICECKDTRVGQNDIGLLTLKSSRIDASNSYIISTYNIPRDVLPSDNERRNVIPIFGNGLEIKNELQKQIRNSQEEYKKQRIDQLLAESLIQIISRITQQRPSSLTSYTLGRLLASSS